ncbi:hypothetical protein [Hymenobacter cellulosivorans]|uniref:Uncharacterized protein n=1 Tax=Hymenobacter cellulosivorans TaxID=2932249 RepID=A0ABY4F5D0_9BACT|nr:hypothetical protein [Hymenobacter cellulosivorans]UOQ51327.1 hypothetical protein MUN80_16355 [Hymenobacter cellulosivorans]
MPLAFPQLLPLPVEGSRYVVRWQSGPGPEVATPPVLPLAFEPHLYLRPEHQALQRFAGEQLTFYLEDQARQLTVAQLHVAADAAQGWGYSPWQAPFGAVQLVPELPAAVLRAFLEQVHAELATRGWTACVCAVTRLSTTRPVAPC